VVRGRIISANCCGTVCTQATAADQGGPFGHHKTVSDPLSSFDTCAICWHNLTQGGVSVGQIASGVAEASRTVLGRAEAGWQMTGELHTVAETAQILKVRESWLKTKASARLVPCTFVGKHLRFSDDDIAEIMRVGTRQPITRRRPSASSDT
jgi:hypothetical protein